MKDSKGNYFHAGDTLVSSECLNTASGIICYHITQCFYDPEKSIAYFESNDNFTQEPTFCLTQKSLNSSKWIKKNK